MEPLNPQLPKALVYLTPFTGSGVLPTPTTNPAIQVGSMYFNQTNGKTYWWTGLVWVDAMGQPVELSGTVSVTGASTASASATVSHNAVVSITGLATVPPITSTLAT
jgi:hypothetical protein